MGADVDAALDDVCVSEDPEELDPDAAVVDALVVVAAGELAGVVVVPRSVAEVVAMEVPIVADPVGLPVVLSVALPVAGMREPEAEPEASPRPWLSYASEHFLTSSKAGFPSLSVIGVRVMMHVSVNGPAIL